MCFHNCFFPYFNLCVIFFSAEFCSQIFRLDQGIEIIAATSDLKNNQKLFSEVLDTDFPTSLMNHTIKDFCDTKLSEATKDLLNTTRCGCLQKTNNCTLMGHGCWRNEDVCSTYKKYPGECVRSGPLYMLGEAICDIKLSPSDEESCTVAETLLAVNLGGKSANDSRGILYAAGDNDTFLRNVTSGSNIVKTKQDFEIYFTFVTGKESESCLQYSFNVTEDGWHEVTLKVIEPTLKGNNQRIMAFEISSGSRLLSPAIYIDPYRSSGGRNRGQELVLYFNVLENGTIAKIRGPNAFIKGRIFNKQIEIRFCDGLARCTGSGSASRNHFVLSGVSVVRFAQASERVDDSRILISDTVNELEFMWNDIKSTLKEGWIELKNIFYDGYKKFIQAMLSGNTPKFC